jgi:hypothetical protein
MPSVALAATPGEEFFERKIRPILVNHCYSCHSTKAKKLRGKLYLDSRAGLLKGGESGPAIISGKPDQSRLIEAVRYTNVDLQMPLRGKLPDAAIADLAAWVKMGAPWPDKGGSDAPTGKEAFNLAKRKKEHWAWKPIGMPAIPQVKDGDWPLGPIDRFLLAGLERKGLAPAKPADKATLLRRLSYDLIGLPPRPQEIEAFLDDRSATAVEKVVDRLLASPRFGERWGRHWLDLVRYGETRGHEFDPLIPNAYQYRDYVIRALNADVHYDRLVLEHLAGDLLPKPRLHPRERFNESILGTGFWFLGEEVHSPVDIRADQADRFDNRLDVMTKTFLGLTVACARCHDHKFDAISTRDYYALFGFLSSSSYRQVRFDSLEHNRQVMAQIARAREKGQPQIQKALAEVASPVVDRAGDYLLAARAVILAGPVFESAKDVVFEDFESGTYAKWEVTGTAFGTKPQTLKTIGAYQGHINAVGKYFVNSHNIRNGENVAQGDAHKGKMTSKSFKISHDFITMLVGGGAHVGKTCVNLVVGGKVVLSATGRNSNQMFPVRWDVRKWRGKSARLQIVDNQAGGWGNIGVDHIVFTNNPGEGKLPIRSEEFSADARKRIAIIANKNRLDPIFLGRWVAYVLAAAQKPDDLLHPFAKIALDPKANDAGHFEVLLRPILQHWKQRQKAAQFLPGKVEVDFGKLHEKDWRPDDIYYGVGPVRSGDLRLEGDPAAPRIHAINHRDAAVVDPGAKGLTRSPGAEKESGALAEVIGSGRTIRTPTFKLTTGKLFYLVKGAGSAYAGVGAHVTIAGPLHGRLVIGLPASNQFHWVAHDLTPYKGQNVHIEFTAKDGVDFGVALVVQGDRMPGSHAPIDGYGFRLISQATSLENLAAGYQDLLDQGRLIGWQLEHGKLFGLDLPTSAKKLAAVTSPIMKMEARLAATLKRASRLAPALQEGSGVDEQVFIRGSHKSLGPVAPRRLLEALAGTKPLAVGSGSGRLELAQQMTDSARNPFIARVIVNRIWHHLFGRGLVASVDNFGVLGEKPTHPELLDYLAARFVREGWSIKKTIRELVLTRAYQMSSERTNVGDKQDPDNLLLHRFRLRRLQGEAIRDALLSISGRLDETPFGPSAPIYLTEFQDGRGKPANGSLDGNGRRSIYLAVRRNFLSPMLLAFDTPSPFSTVGRRTVSNVPAQSLILMNDPFVHQQAALWAQRIVGMNATSSQGIQAMYLSAFGRLPTAPEQKTCEQFLARQAKLHGVKPGAPAVWTDLAHALINVKEFIYLH